jgi:hypothetical protein
VHSLKHVSAVLLAIVVFFLFAAFSARGAEGDDKIRRGFEKFLRELENSPCEALLSGHSLLNQQGVYSGLLHRQARALSPDAKVLIKTFSSRRFLDAT